MEVPEGTEATAVVLGTLRDASPPGVVLEEIAEVRERSPAAAGAGGRVQVRARRRRRRDRRGRRTLQRRRERGPPARDPKGTRTLDLKKYAGSVAATPEEGGARLGFTIRHRSDGAARPQELIDQIAEWAQVER